MLLIFSLFSCNNSGQQTTPENKSTNSTYQAINNDDSSQKKSNQNIAKDTSVITNIAEFKTSMGTFTVGLYGLDAPKTVKNFVGLIQKGYYNDILIHRIAKNFVIQLGDRNTLNKNKPQEWGIGGTSIYGKEFEDELNPHTPSFQLGYVKGTLAMANKGPNTNTSQFFICLNEAIKLDHKYTIFGKVMNGLDLITKISQVDIQPRGADQNDGIPKNPIKIIYAKLLKMKN